MKNIHVRNSRECVPAFDQNGMFQFEPAKGSTLSIPSIIEQYGWTEKRIKKFSENRARAIKIYLKSNPKVLIIGNALRQQVFMYLNSLTTYNCRILTKNMLKPTYHTNKQQKILKQNLQVCAIHLSCLTLSTIVF